MNRPAARKHDLIEDIYPLTPAQQGILFHYLYAPDSGMYYNQTHCIIRGTLQTVALKQTWVYMLERYSVLRTGFIWDHEEQPFQVVYKQAKLPWHELDWRGLPPEEQRARLEAYIQADRAQPFDVGKPPLARMALFQTADERYDLVFTHHHLLLDGWSLPVLFKQVFALYAALHKRQQLELPPTRPFGDYVAWLQKQNPADTESFWRALLKDFAEPTSLQIEMLPEQAGAAEYATRRLVLPEQASTALRQLARIHEITLNTLMLGAWAILLGRYGDADDVLFGVTVSGRPPDLGGVDTMVGMFINTLPMRVQLFAGEPLIDWLHGLQRLQVEMRQYEYSSLADIQRWSAIPRGTPLFESILVYENFPVDPYFMEAGLGVEVEKQSSIERTNYPLTLVIAPTAALQLIVHHDAQRFGAERIDQLLVHLQAILEAFVADPSRRAGDLPMLPDAERRQLLAGWNSPTPRAVPDRCLHELFTAQAMQRPDAVAAVFEDEHLTYGELFRRASDLAWRLHACGVGPEAVVGLYLERSLELIIGIVGILQAGGAYLPLDPLLPPERLAFTLADARADMVVTHTALRQTLPSTSAAVIILDPDGPAGTRTPLPPRPVCPENLAYVIYTSGSTGTPKGTMVTHANVVRLLDITAPWGHFSPQDVWTLFHSTAFDFSVWEIWGALGFGGRLVVVPYWISRSPEAFLDLLRAHHVSILNQTPSAFRQLDRAEALATQGLGMSLRLVIFGGEALDLQHLESWFARHGDQHPQLANMYGITETTVHVTYRPLTRADAAASRSVIGRPLADMQAYVLDRRLRPLPIGVRGELYVGGAGVSRGYLGRASLTAERFVPNPFDDQRPTTNDERPTTDHRPPTTDKETRRQGDERRTTNDERRTTNDKETANPKLNTQHSTLDTSPSETQHSTLNTQHSRLYRTGDLAYHLPDGDIVYVGRRDNQIKIRGFRIELGEIESALAQAPGVREAVVAQVGEAGDRRLAAYIVPTNDQRPTTNDQRQGDKQTRGQADKETEQSTIYNLQSAIPETLSSIFYPLSSELRAFLQERLPDYMIPAFFVQLAALPLTPNGKIDRRALPAPDRARPEQERTFVAPRTPTEIALAEIWAQVLGVPQVGVHDNFFVLGGDSILSIQVLAQAKGRQLGVTLEQLFAHPTIADLAQIIAPAESAPEQPEPAVPGHSALDALVARIEHMSDTETARLLRELNGG